MTALITGASNGIGKQIAKDLAENGMNVVINYKNSKAEAINLRDELLSRGKNAIAVKADISKKIQVEEMFKIISENFGGVDILVNNAGISSQKVLQDISLEEWDETFDVNVKGAFLCTKGALRHMIEKKYGKIINISSIWGITGASCEVHYSTTKAALIGFTKSLAKELAPSGITVNCVAPGVIFTNMNAAFSDETIKSLIEETPLGRIGTVVDISNTVMFLASEKADFITGQVISPNGGILI